MDLSTAQQILVIVLASALGVFLVVGIVLTVIVVRLVQALRRVVNTAEHVVQSAESAAGMLKNMAGPVGVLKAVRSVVEMVQKHKK